MARFLFWKKKKDPGSALAQDLANALRTSVAGFVPQPPYDRVNLDRELFISSNVALASLVILSVLLKGDHSRREIILQSIKPEYLGEESLESYLFHLMADELRDRGSISAADIEEQLPHYTEVVYGQAADERTLQGNLYRWNQVLEFNPTDAHLHRAIEQCREWAKKKGLLDEC